MSLIPHSSLDFLCLCPVYDASGSVLPLAVATSVKTFLREGLHGVFEYHLQ